MAIYEANEFTDSCVGHNGASNPWPPFHTDLEAVNKDLVDERSRNNSECLCYHSRLSIAENVVGVLINVTRLPRSGGVKEVSTSKDFLCLRAFVNEGIRLDLDNEAFQMWMPLYFGETNVDKTLHLLKKSLSMICTGTTKRFEESQVMEVLPKLQTTLIVEMLKNKKIVSTKLLRLFLMLHRLFVLCLNHFPKVREEVENRIKSFVASEQGRVKDKCSSLGDVIALFNCVDVQGISWKEFITAYVDESFDRNVLWLLRLIPELAEEGSKSIEEERLNITYNANPVSWQIVMFHAYMRRVVLAKGLKTHSQSMDTMWGRLPWKDEDLFQQNCKLIQKIDSFKHYFGRIDYQYESNSMLVKMLRNAVGNSARKKYHGEDDHILELPSTDVQMNVVRDKRITLDDFKRLLGKNSSDNDFKNILFQK